MILAISILSWSQSWFHDYTVSPNVLDHITRRKRSSAANCLDDGKCKQFQGKQIREKLTAFIYHYFHI